MNEVELARLENWNELIRMGQIVVPALIAGFTGFLGGWWQHKRRIKTLEDAREFSARELLFNFRKERLDSLKESSTDFVNGLSQIFGVLIGAIAAGDAPQGLLDMAEGQINEAAKTLCFTIREAQKDFPDSRHFPKFEEKLEWYLQQLNKYVSRETLFDIQALNQDLSFIHEAFAYVILFTEKVLEDELTETVNKYVRKGR